MVARALGRGPQKYALPVGVRLERVREHARHHDGTCRHRSLSALWATATRVIPPRYPVGPCPLRRRLLCSVVPLGCGQDGEGPAAPWWSSGRAAHDGGTGLNRYTSMFVTVVESRVPWVAVPQPLPESPPPCARVRPRKLSISGAEIDHPPLRSRAARRRVEGRGRYPPTRAPHLPGAMGGGALRVWGRLRW